MLANTFYLYDAGHGVYETTNGGATWTQVFNGSISAASNFNAELESVPGEAGNLFFTGGPQGGSQPVAEGFYQSTNGGATWTAVPNVLEVNCFGFGAAAPGQSYPSMYIVGWVNNVYGVWESTNDAKSWTQLGTYPLNSLDHITTISGDPNIYGQVYVGFQGSGYAYLPANATVDTPPTVTDTGGTTAWTEASGIGPSTPAGIDSGVTVSDPDSTTLASATVSITGGFQSNQDVLAFSNNGSTMGNIAGSYNSSTGVLSLTSSGATATLAQWQAALDAVTYNNSSA